MKVLVTGGAGYVGSHCVKQLLLSGHDVLIYDNLSQGHPEACPPGRLVIGDILDGQKLGATLQEHKIEAVMHFAALALVGESVGSPTKYYQTNVIGTFTLLEAMKSAGVSRLVFSSSCATYGIPKSVPIRETTTQSPVNPYGETKLICEKMMRDYSHAYGLGYAALRYFNAAGASTDASIGEDHDPESHLIPILLQTALGQRESAMMYGDDYPTPDGSCIRDYIHVNDLADAHIRALEMLKHGTKLEVNLGTGKGSSVKEVVAVCRQVSGREICLKVGPRRPGDPPELVADPSLAKEVLGWSAKRSDLQTIVEDAWRWHSTHPTGYSTGAHRT